MAQTAHPSYVVFDDLLPALRGNVFYEPLFFFSWCRFDEVLHREAYLYSRPQATHYNISESEHGYREAYSPTQTQVLIAWQVSVGF